MRFDQLAIYGFEVLPIRMVGNKFLGACPGIEDFRVFFLPVLGHKEKGLAEVKHALHAEAEFADGGLFCSFAIEAKRQDGPIVFVLELTVIDKIEGWPFEEWMLSSGDSCG